MSTAERIFKEAQKLPDTLAQEVLDFIEFLKAKQKPVVGFSKPTSAIEIEAFFRSFTVDTSQFKFDREEANAR